MRQRDNRQLRAVAAVAPASLGSSAARVATLRRPRLGLILLLVIVNAVLWMANELLRSWLPPNGQPRRFFASLLPTHSMEAAAAALPPKSGMPVQSLVQVAIQHDNEARAAAFALLLQSLGARTMPDAANADTVVLVLGAAQEWADSQRYIDEARPSLRLVIGTVLGLDETLSDISGLSHALQLCAAQHGRGVCADGTPALPPVFVMPSQASLWRAASTAWPLWVVREPGGAPRHAESGRIVSATRMHLLPIKGGASYLLQPYLGAPMLWRGRKHSIRLAVVLSSVRPIRLYLRRAAQVRIAARPYADANALNTTLDDVCMHSTSPSRAAACDADSIAKSAAPKETRLLMTNDPKYTAGLPSEHAAHFESVLWARMARAVRTAMLASAPLLSAYADMLHENGARYRTAALLRVDTLMTADGLVHIEEVHAPDGQLLSPGDTWEADAAREALALLGVGRGYPKRAEYAARVAGSIHTVCVGVEDDARCDEEERAALWALADEDAHAGGYERLVPPVGLHSAGPDALMARAMQGRLANMSAQLARLL